MERLKRILFYTLLFLFILAFSATANGYDYDLWARLIAGMSVLQGNGVLKLDFLSYTPTHLWFDHEWGSGVIFYATEHFFSSTGLLFLQAFLAFLVFFFIIKTVELRGVKTTSPYNFLFYFFTFQAMAQGLNEPVRCQMFSFVFFALFLYILEIARKGNDKVLWLLPLMMIFWNNLHGGCVSGLGLILIYIIGEFLNKAPVKKYIYAFALSALVLPINPWGIEYLGFLIPAVTMKRPDVVEWWGAFSTYNLYRYLKFKFYAAVMLICGLIAQGKPSDEKTDKTKQLLLLVTLFLAIQHVKMIPFFVISAAALLYDDFYSLFNRFFAKFFDKIAPFKNAVVYLVILIFAFSNLKSKAFEPIVRADKYPLREIEFIKINEIKGNLLINFGYGSYAAYKLYPDNLIFMDGRYEEVYYPYMVPLLKKFCLANEGWQELLQKFPPDVIVIEKSYPIYSVLNSGKDWKNVYESEKFAVFTKTSKAIKTYKKPPQSLEYYKKTHFDTNVRFMLKSKNDK